MAKIQLDQTLVYKAKRRFPESKLSPDTCIQINLLWRKQVRTPILARVFGVSKNTIYYRCLTGKADSYPNNQWSNTADDTNKLIDSIGEEQAWEKYMTDEIVTKVNEAMAEEVRKRAA